MSRWSSCVRERTQLPLTFLLFSLLHADLGELLHGHVDHALFTHYLNFEHTSVDGFGEFVDRFELGRRQYASLDMQG